MARPDIPCSNGYVYPSLAIELRIYAPPCILCIVQVDQNYIVQSIVTSTAQGPAFYSIPSVTNQRHMTTLTVNDI